MKRLLRWEEIMIIELVIYRITHFFQGTIDWLQQINFIGGCDRDNGETIFFVIEKSKKATFDFSQNAVCCIKQKFKLS